MGFYPHSFPGEILYGRSLELLLGYSWPNFRVCAQLNFWQKFRSHKRAPSRTSFTQTRLVLGRPDHLSFPSFGRKVITLSFFWDMPRSVDRGFDATCDEYSFETEVSRVVCLLRQTRDVRHSLTHPCLRLPPNPLSLLPMVHRPLPGAGASAATRPACPRPAAATNGVRPAANEHHPVSVLPAQSGDPGFGNDLKGHTRTGITISLDSVGAVIKPGTGTTTQTTTTTPRDPEQGQENGNVKTLLADVR